MEIAREQKVNAERAWHSGQGPQPLPDRSIQELNSFADKGKIWSHVRKDTDRSHCLY